MMASSSFTEELRDTASAQWNRVIQHKFTKELAAGTVSRDVLQRYLIQDHRFLNAFVVLLASIIAHCRTLQDRIPGCQFLAMITGKENTYFQRSFEVLHCTEELRCSIPDAPCTTGFCNLMREVAMHGTLGEMLSVIVVCEWSYLSWGRLVEGETLRDDFTCYEWVDLHSGEHFEHVVAYLRDLLDREGEHMNDAEKEKCKKRFSHAVQLEEDFFEFAYHG
jgi:thiaminase (transcriptional activator TenA)